MSDTATIPSLPSRPWKTTYRQEDGDLIGLFYVPALSCAVGYDRLTGYFSADALALASRGIGRLIANGGRMRLIVGCTLAEEEVRAIEQGYDLRAIVESNLVKVSLEPPDMEVKGGLSALAWLVAQGKLDVKVAVPIGPGGRPVPGHSLYHEKVGIITDNEGNRLSFSGSINETRGGWVNNRESFHVFGSWLGEYAASHVADDAAWFDRLWNEKVQTVKVLDFPEAVRNNLLAFQPTGPELKAIIEGVTGEPGSPLGTQHRPPSKGGDGPTLSTDPLPGSTVATHGTDPLQVDPPVIEPEPPHRLMPDEVRRVVWSYIQNAPRMPNGQRVGEVTSTVKPWRHQSRSFARMYQGWPCRVLIADEVGLGKTISTGLLIRQAWLSGVAKRILLMVPASVMPQWQNELYEKFNLNVPIYDGQKLVWRKTHATAEPRERKVGRDEWHREGLVLCSSHLMRRRDRADDLLQAEGWDLIVLDEAHHARRRAPGSPQEGGPNRLLRLMSSLKDKARSLVLLTATPMQVHPVEVWDLLNLLGLPPRWAAGADGFVEYFKLSSGNPGQADLEFLAGMFRDVEAAFGPVDEGAVGRLVPAATPLTRQRILKALREQASGIPLKRLGATERKIALEILRRFSPIRHLMSRHTRELLRDYHKKGLLDTPIATRDPRDIVVEMNPAERELYDAVEEYISTTYNNASQDKRSAVGFVMTIYRRRLASSFHALKQTLTKRLADERLALTDEDLSQDEQTEEVMDVEDAARAMQEGLVVEERASILGLLKKIAKLGTDTKVKRVKAEIEDAFDAGYHSAIVFTQYTDTMDYLKAYLAVELPDVPIACYSGRGGEVRDQGGYWNKCGKEVIKKKLKDGAIRLLICTDAAAEGLNFQTCGVVINLDLPWNPMKVEQRIGRIDRIGQKYPVIRVVNFAYEDTVEADVYFALGRRINLFQGIVGKLQPILSRLPQEFEKVALERPEHREAARQRFMADVEGMVDGAEEGGFDVDEVADEALDVPDLPEPALCLSDIDRALNREGVLPPGAELARLDLGSYKIRLPGGDAWVRVTTDAEVFDDHAESHEFLSPGGPLFEALAAPTPDGTSESGAAAGHCWLVEAGGDGGACEMHVLTTDGARRVDSLGDLLERLDRLPNREGFDGPRHPEGSCVRRLA